ncbi:MAG: APC family permease [Actinomycetota bacterium]|nr:APC family permease [Actinomycetota bacterium]
MAENGDAGKLAQVFRTGDLVSLSVSSVGPLFSIAATGGVMAAAAGWFSLVAIGLIAIPFIVSAFVFRLLNRHFPHAGASYHWSRRVLGARSSRFQAWILIVAYFSSIPPIIIPAANYTLTLIAPGQTPGPLAELATSAFWVGFALVPLLRGAKPTARITQVFLLVEVVSVAGLAAIALYRLPELHVPVHASHFPLGGVIISAVVAATILDGWEIDSYAAEESRRPKRDPGTAGIVGAFLALAFYAVLFPLMLDETPLRVLAGAANPMAAWGDRLLPSAPWAVLLPVLASTAGGLWLTSFILGRALFAMGREGLLPGRFARLNHRQVPAFALVSVLLAALAVTALQTLYPSLRSFFGLVLGAAGFFLTAEFFLDSLTATVFLSRLHGAGKDGEPDAPVHHHHTALRVAATGTTVVLGAFLCGFLVFGPTAIGSGIDWVVAAVVTGGLLFAWIPRRGREAYIFEGGDVTTGLPLRSAASTANRT